MSLPAVSLPALVAFEDGTVFKGVGFGATGSRTGEIVFNTAMTGYQEILTDPSYARQIVTLTYPHIGNTGCTAEDNESRAAFAAGLIVRELPGRPSSWRAQTDLDSWLRERDVVAIAGLDTRAITRRIRRGGVQSATIAHGEDLDAEHAIEQARKFPGLAGMELASQVALGATCDWIDAMPALSDQKPEAKPGAVVPAAGRRVVVLDFGIKQNTLRHLVESGCEVRVVPGTASASTVLAERPDGIVLSNGPGDPQASTDAIGMIAELIEAKVPIFGICLGHQLLALAVGAQTVKMKTGHHGANHPVLEIATGRVIISSQNHGFAVDAATLPARVRETHRSLFDGSNQGLELTDAPVFSVQGHPEAGPGPHDWSPMFSRFVEMIDINASKFPRYGAKS